MKQIFTTIFLFIAVLASGQQEPLKVLASASMWADMAENIGGDLIEIDLIVPIGGDPHTYEPTPGDAKKVSDADLILINGLTFEGWINELIENSGTNAETILVTKYITPISSDIYKGATDPHAWMNASNGKLYCKAIYEALIKAIPNKSEELTANYEKYNKKLDQLDSYISLAIESIPEKQRVLITSHDAFKYYGEAYGLQLEAIQGISTESEAQFSDMKRVTDVIMHSNVPAVFIESTINPKMLKQIAEDNGVNVGGQLYADSLGDEDSDGGSYFGMLKHNTDVIVNALTNKSLSEVKVSDSESSTILIYFALALVLLLILGGVFYKLN